MAKTNSVKLTEAYEAIEKLEQLLDERIIEMNTVGKLRPELHKQATHCYCYYREILWDAKYNLRDVIQSKEVSK